MGHLWTIWIRSEIHSAWQTCKPTLKIIAQLTGRCSWIMRPQRLRLLRKFRRPRCKQGKLKTSLANSNRWLSSSRSVSRKLRTDSQVWAATMRVGPWLTIAKAAWCLTSLRLMPHCYLTPRMIHQMVHHRAGTYKHTDRITMRWQVVVQQAALLIVE